MAEPAQQHSRIVIRRLLVKGDRIVARVQVDPTSAYSTQYLAEELVRTRPDLPEHACVNPFGDRFGDVISHTSLPHVLEHLVIDFQTEASSADRPDYVFVGITKWIDKAHGIADIAVSYRDDLIALRAFRDAAVLLNSLR